RTHVPSRTFAILHEYRAGRLPVYHFDLFRVENPQALARLGLDDYFFGDGISVIEWADRFPEFVREEARWIFFEIKSETHRAITFQRRVSRLNFPPPAAASPGSMERSKMGMNGLTTGKTPHPSSRISMR